MVVAFVPYPSIYCDTAIRSPTLISPFSLVTRVGTRPVSAIPTFSSSMYSGDVLNPPRSTPGSVVMIPRGALSLEFEV